MSKRLCALAAALLPLLFLLPGCAQAQWRLLGPYGGNARALAYSYKYPDRLLLGSGAGALFESFDGGRQWHYFAHLGQGNELMIKNIAFDPSDSLTIYVAGWNVSGSGGGFFVTHDGGHNWSQPAALLGKSIQALAIAKSDSHILVAGALDGLYRSKDGAKTWQRISPKGHPDLKNFESVAIDPHDPEIIYAGTWHLPWKTLDGGVTWSNIKKGVIDDSDVFSIILDSSEPKTVFASACSGIYKSQDGGRLFRKVQGIPGTAQRTRVLQQDRTNPGTVYAGTTEGLFKTIDGGETFTRITPRDFILNDVLIDPRDSNRVLIATDRGGVFASDDAGASFHPSNEGFSQRQLTTVVADPNDATELYVGAVNDKEFGGVFRRHNGNWAQINEGLEGRDVFDLGISWQRRLVAATNRGILVWNTNAGRWQPGTHGVIPKLEPKPLPKSQPVRGRKSKAKRPPPKPQNAVMVPAVFDDRAWALSLENRRWYAATEVGVLHSDNEGASWSGGAIGKEKSFISVSAHGGIVVAASLRDVWYSANYAQHWTHQSLPAWVTRVYSVTVTSDDSVWVCTRDGALRLIRKSLDEGEWERVLNGLPARDVSSIHQEGDLLVASVAGANTVYVSRDHGRSWDAVQPPSAYEVTGAVMQGSSTYVTTRYHGVLVREYDTRQSVVPK